MKRFILIALALMMALSLAACGGNEETPSGSGTTAPGTSQQGQSGGTELEDINANNWDQVIKDNFGLELALPEGWSVSEASSPNKRNNIEIKFVKGGNETYESFGEKIFAELQRIAEGDITHRRDTAKVYSSFDDANMDGMVSAKIVSAETKNIITIQYFDGGTSVTLYFSK